MNVGLRKFPYPYRAALAISSDVDNTPDTATYFAMLDYLNGTGSTPFGQGLGLEVGNSFWFFNGTGGRQVSYFDSDGRETDFAAPCRQLWESGHIDTLHSYGNFDTGGFTRQHAEKGVAALQTHGATIPVWVNHGNEHNSQNVGPHGPFHGGQPDSPAYHMDLTREAGMRYYWIGRLTHILGQDARRRFGVTAKRWLQELVRLLRYRNIDRAFYDFSNRLILPATLQDGATVWDFQRWVNAWGEVTELDAVDLAVQLRPRNIAALIRNAGFLIIYTHMTENLPAARGLPDGLEAGLKNLKRAHDEGRLLVATSGRLLRYRELSQFVDYHATASDGGTLITIAPRLSTPVGDLALAPSDLNGLTFHVDDPDKVEVTFGGKVLATASNPPDETGRPSISIPWVALEYPRA